MTKLSISRAWDETRAIVGRDGKLLLTVSAALFLLPQAIAGLATGQGEHMAQNLAASLLMFVALLIGVIGQLSIAWLAYGSRVSVGEAISHSVKRALPLIGALLLMVAIFAAIMVVVSGVLMAAGLINVSATEVNVPGMMLALLIGGIPILYISVRLLPTIPVASIERVGPLGILKRSWAMTRGHFWRLFAFVVIIAVAALILAGAIGAVGGLIVNVAFGDPEPFTLSALLLSLFNGLVQAVIVLLYLVMLTRIYVQLTGQEQPEASVPHSGG